MDGVDKIAAAGVTGRWCDRVDEDRMIECRERPLATSAAPGWGPRVARELFASFVEDEDEAVEAVEEGREGFAGGDGDVMGTSVVVVGRRFGVDFLPFSDRIAVADHLNSAGQRLLTGWVWSGRRMSEADFPCLPPPSASPEVSKSLAWKG